MAREEPREVRIESESDIVDARRKARGLATQLGFGITDVTRVVTAVSELARNIFRFAGSGVMEWDVLQGDDSTGIEFRFRDRGPGIPDIEQAMEVGYSSGGGLGMGLAGSKRLMDEMEIESEVGKGTIVTVRKWKRP